MTGSQAVTNEEILFAACEWFAGGAGVVLARVLSVWGSAPYPVGSCMAIRDDGHFLGSVSGGCIEGDVIAESAALLEEGGFKTLEFGISNTQAWEAGLSCGGKIRIFLEVLNERKARLINQVCESLRERTPALLVTDLTDGEVSSLDVSQNADLPIALSGRGQADMREALTAAVREDASRAVSVDDKMVFVHVFHPPLKLFVIGAVHIAQALVQFAALMKIEVIIVDPRMAFASAERFPNVEIESRWPDEALRDAGLDSRCAVVTLTHDPKLDDAALRMALTSSAFYIGSLGSKKSHAARLKRLERDGFDDDALSRIHGPVGLDIGSKSPSDIALSIAAEIVHVLRKPGQ